MLEQSAPGIDVIKQSMANMWANGDFGIVAKTLMPAAYDLINSLDIQKHSKVLDVACGSGNLSIVSAEKGANVKGLDIVDDLIRQANERAKEKDFDIEFIVGDAEDMPYPDNEFDYVITMFGAMFCPRPDLAAKELFRVCKPGGIVAMANWTQNDFARDFFGIVSKYAPPPPPGVPKPNEWGDEEIVKDRFREYASDIQCTKRTTELTYDYDPAGTADYYIKYFGPVKTVYENINDEQKEVLRNDLTDMFEKYYAANEGRNVVIGEYLQVIATKAK